MDKESDRCIATAGRNYTRGLEYASSDVECKGEVGCGRGGIGRSNARYRSLMVENQRPDMRKDGEW